MQHKLLQETRIHYSIKLTIKEYISSMNLQVFGQKQKVFKGRLERTTIGTNNRKFRPLS